MSKTTAAMASSSTKETLEKKKPIIPITPTRRLYIHPSHLFGNKIVIDDLGHLTPTQTTTPPHDSDSQNTPKDTNTTFVISRKGFLSIHMIMTSTSSHPDPKTGKLPDDNDDKSTKHVADWKIPLSAAAETHLTFPEGSQHCSHEIRMRPHKMSDKESFVFESAEFVWKRDWDGGALRGLEGLGLNKIGRGKAVNSKGDGDGGEDGSEEESDGDEEAARKGEGSETKQSGASSTSRKWLSKRPLKLEKYLGDRRMVVARSYDEDKEGKGKHGRMVEVDEKEIDFVVAVLTACVMARKKGLKEGDRLGF